MPEIQQPTPGVYRLNHPDFLDVYRTTFAKGTITKFQQLQDNPIEVASLVKVKVGDQEYDDWLPLFFRPKAQYWDDDGRQAVDFNEEGKYFEKAWMSFRGGDEVVVLLQQNTPQAVLAFADGLPRLGESAFRLEWQMWNGVSHRIHFQGSPWVKYGNEDQTPDPPGPDGANLGLVTEAMQICKTAEILYQTIHYTSGPPITHGDSYRYVQYFEWLITLGPYYFILQMLETRNHDTRDPQYGGGDSYMAYYGLVATTDTTINEVIAQGQANSGLNPYTDIYIPRIYNVSDWGYLPAPPPCPGYPGWNLYPWLVQHPGFVAQHTSMWNFISIPDLHQNVLNPPYQPNPNTFKIYQRPHTKEELQAAGMALKENK